VRDLGRGAGFIFRLLSLVMERRLPMKVREEKNNEILVCSLEGELDIGSSPQLRKTFESIIQRDEKKVLVDFSGISYIDSSGLATLIEMFHRLKKIGGALRLCALDRKIKNIFEVTKLHKLFVIFENRELALKDF
jgi:anti-anti-sigma factor